ncbi:MAG TPA: phage tail sheath subtilisin-like domain-containing protein [Steroidobacteraceae bacterium]|jgi:phage tail sheath protein FI|nr:phage tail sheath subtilisin-like domain-containing protein [Steroidobacteraceae bacterium]
MAQTQYLAPGIYVEEVPSAIKAIVGVSTSTAGFVGIVQDTVQLLARNPAGPAPTKLVDFTTPAAKQPLLFTNWSQFERAYGGFLGKEGDAASTAQNAKIDENHRRLAHAVYGFFNNGGSRCYVARVTAEADLAAALDAFATIDEIALVCVPGVLSDSARELIVNHCVSTQDRFAILDGPGPDPADLAKLPLATTDGGLSPKTTDFAAWYYPWLKVFDPATQLQQPDGDGVLSVPPSGHIAGIYARVDTERGVFKAPANEVVRGALDLTHPLSKNDQGDLNKHGVNCIRALNGNIYVWGARTVGGDANADLKYVSVRRTLLFLRESIDEGTQWAVFEPNTPALWAKISRNVTAFLTTVWRSGALFGTTAQEAFFVKCDAETNPPELREQGQVVTEIGVAIARPAEFVIFRVSQFAAPTK